MSRLPSSALLAALSLCIFHTDARAASDDIQFTASLSPEEVAKPATGPARGCAEVWLERETLKISWKITFDKLSSPGASLALYGPESPGSIAGKQVDLAGPGMKSPIEGSKQISEGQFQSLITSKMYVNLNTLKFPEGELRGQLLRSRRTRASGDSGLPSSKDSCS